MLGKTFKGLTDELLEWQTEKLRALALDPNDRGYVVAVRPELVVEIAFNELQASRRYPGGLALRLRARRAVSARQAARGCRHDRHRAARSPPHSTAAHPDVIWNRDEGVGASWHATCTSLRAANPATRTEP